jgi:hypothetical protein
VANNNLTKYIKEALVAGKSVNELHRTLDEVGWEKTAIQESLTEIGHLPIDNRITRARSEIVQHTYIPTWLVYSIIVLILGALTSVCFLLLIGST